MLSGDKLVTDYPGLLRTNNSSGVERTKQTSRASHYSIDTKDCADGITVPSRALSCR
ncbi:hypothetical protein SAMN05414139_02936 [Burkholderia sp. D7]|nr:hypothetical protein SAMN05414139_02936 [Burkholderia sp. D7]